MTDGKKTSPKQVIKEGYQPGSHNRGYQPMATNGYQAVTSKPNPQGGHQPTTSQGPKKPPTGGSSES